MQTYISSVDLQCTWCSVHCLLTAHLEAFTGGIKEHGISESFFSFVLLCLGIRLLKRFASLFNSV